MYASHLVSGIGIMGFFFKKITRINMLTINEEFKEFIKEMRKFLRNLPKGVQDKFTEAYLDEIKALPGTKGITTSIKIICLGEDSYTMKGGEIELAGTLQDVLGNIKSIAQTKYLDITINSICMGHTIQEMLNWNEPQLQPPIPRALARRGVSEFRESLAAVSTFLGELFSVIPGCVLSSCRLVLGRAEYPYMSLRPDDPECMTSIGMIFVVMFSQSCCFNFCLDGEAYFGSKHEAMGWYSILYFLQRYKEPHKILPDSIELNAFDGLVKASSDWVSYKLIKPVEANFPSMFFECHMPLYDKESYEESIHSDTDSNDSDDGLEAAKMPSDKDESILKKIPSAEALSDILEDYKEMLSAVLLGKAEPDCSKLGELDARIRQAIAAENHADTQGSVEGPDAHAQHHMFAPSIVSDASLSDSVSQLELGR